MGGAAHVPGDKSIAHRWLMLAATAEGTSTLEGLPAALDVRSTARCLAASSGSAGLTLQQWAGNPRVEGDGFTWDTPGGSSPESSLVIEGEGFSGLRPAQGPLDCENSGTTMRLLCGLLAGTGFEATLIGDPSLSRRPMERVAEPLRMMGARVETEAGHPPVRISGGRLKGILYAPPVPSAQVKSAVLLAGLSAEGETVVQEAVPTRDHTERALRALGAAVRLEPGSIAVSRSQHRGFEARLPGDPSSAAYLMAAAAVCGVPLELREVGLNPTRTRFLDVMRRMGVAVAERVEGLSLGEPFGSVVVSPTAALGATVVTAEELPLVVDEIPVLAALASCAEGVSRFEGAAELRVKESDRLAGLAEGLRGLGSRARVSGDTLEVGVGTSSGGGAGALGDHRLAMAFVVAALGAASASVVDGIEAADVSFPGFVGLMRGLGARMEET